MKYSVIVGSENPVKIMASKESLAELDTYLFEVSGIDIDSGVNDQPQSFTETLNGARNRAQQAYSSEYKFSIGLEDGIFVVPDTENIFMNICICVIFDGQTMHYGTSSAFEYPHEITDLVRGRGLDISEALGAAGYTGNSQIGSAEGAIGILSKGKLVRKDYTKQALTAAFIHLNNFLDSTI